MIHNGIEYADMQLIAEVYDVMRTVLGMSNKEIADSFDEWNKGELDSYLIEITSKILRKADDITGIGQVVDYVMDKTGSKGTGKWTVQEATAKGIAIPTIAAALDARILSGLKDERVAASRILIDASSKVESIADRKLAIDDLGHALYAAKVCSYAQGLSLIKAVSDEYGWNIDLSECARLWTGGCIIRAALLQDIQAAFASSSSAQQPPPPANLMVSDKFSSLLSAKTGAWRRTIVRCVSAGIACPALMSSIAYFDTYRRERLPAKLTQCQRDFFGGHSVERIDRDGHFHVVWTEAHHDIGDVNERTAGEDVEI
jgi:6-phosphogluconate dehydrogenase